MRARLLTTLLVGLLSASAAAQPAAPARPAVPDAQPGPEAATALAPALPADPAVEPGVSAAPSAQNEPPPPSASPSATALASDPAAPASSAAQPQPAQEEEALALEQQPGGLASFMSRVHLHGFISQGAFVSTANDYIGDSSRGSLKFFEAGINVSVDLTDRLRAGMQFVSRSVGTLSQEVPRVDWAFLDYRFRGWFGMRAGVIKLPMGLYNEYVDIDAARTAILLPASVYPLRNRDALISHIGFAAYGNVPFGAFGELAYHAWLGTLNIPRSALELDGGDLDSVETRYITGGQLFWQAPLEGLRLGATYLRASIDFNITLSPGTVDALIMAGAVPADYQGQLLIAQRPTSFWVASAEYIHGDWLLAAEYSRWRKHQINSLPETLLPTLDEDSERFYGMVSYRFSPLFELGSYYSVTHLDVDDRDGKRRAATPGTKRYQGFQRDLSLSLRLDVNEYWLWKVEGHFMDGTGDLLQSLNPDPRRYWGMFLLKTTVTF